MPIRITGLNSGLDTEAIISALVSSYNYKTDKYKKAQTKLSWKQDAWKTLNTKIYSLYTSLDSLRFSNGYNLKTTNCSDTTKATVTATSNAVNGTQSLNVLQVAQAGYLTGGKLDNSVTANTTLAELGYTGGNGAINVTLGDGTTKSVEVSQGTTITSFVNSLKEAGVNASYDEVNKRLFVSSKETGAENDFTLTGANVDGASALNKLGLSVSSDSTQATYESYAKYYYNGYDISAGVAAGNVTQNVKDAITAYQDAKEAYDKASAQNGNLTAAYGYASAYSAMKQALEGSGLSATDQDKLQKLLGMTATERVKSVMDASGTVYSAADSDADGNTIYSDGNGNYIQSVVTFKDSAGNAYTENDDGTFKLGDVTYTATGAKDADGNALYSAGDGTNPVAIKADTAYYRALATEEGTGYNKITDADGKTYTQNDTGTYSGTDGTQYTLSDGKLLEVDSDRNVVSGGKEVTVQSTEEITKTVYTQGEALSGVDTSSNALTALKEEIKTASSFTDDDLNAFVNTLSANVGAVNAYEKTADLTLDSSDPYSRASITAAVQNAYTSNGSAGVTSLVNGYADLIAANKTVMDASQVTMDEHSRLADIAVMEDGTDKDNAIAEFVTEVNSAVNIIATQEINSDAKKIDGQDAIINLNGIEYTGSSNAFSINGLTITAQAVTGAGEENAVTITTQTDTQGIYDKIKGFLTQYNSLINEITSLYNAAPAKGYEPLTSEEKDAMSDTEVELWEEKIKDSLLRRDDSLESVMSAMTSSMSKGVEINGKTYYLSTFGIKSLGYLNAPENQQNAYHIDGDEDDPSVLKNPDKLMTALTTDPETVMTFMQELVGGLYTTLGDKMKATTLSSTYTVYNDKEMASEYSDYTDLIKKWEDKLSAQEDYYYNKFSVMETALAKLQSQTSSLSSLLGS